MTRLLALSIFVVSALCTSHALGQARAIPNTGFNQAGPAAGQTAPAGQAATAGQAVRANQGAPAAGQFSPVAGQATPVRQPGDIQPIGPPVIAAPGNPQAALPPMPQQPEWAARMTPEEQKWIDDVLHFWEQRSDKIKVFECKFQKWDYENGWLNPANGQRSPRTFAEGTIKYAQPDKGLFQVERLVSILPPNQAGGQPQTVEQSADLGEHWICDGTKIYAFEANKKQVTVTPLPAEMRGKALADGPLPFMFGARAETIKARYWIHGLADNEPGQYKLEAVPKSREDAQNFKKVIIILDQKDYLPDKLQIFAPNFDPPRNDARQTYAFSKREAKEKNNVAQGFLDIFTREFYEPKVPTGWKKVVQDPGNTVATPAPQNVPAGPPVQQAVPPARQAPTVR